VKCTNPECFIDSPYLRDGSLHLLELESHRRIESNERGFPMRASPQRFFWLCVDCTKQFTIAKWTPSGVVLALRKLVTLTSDMGALDSAVSRLSAGDPRRALFHAARWKSPPQQEG
jgi:hypothetical protein